MHEAVGFRNRRLRLWRIPNENSRSLALPSVARSTTTTSRRRLRRNARTAESRSSFTGLARTAVTTAVVRSSRRKNRSKTCGCSRINLFRWLGYWVARLESWAARTCGAFPAHIFQASLQVFKNWTAFLWYLNKWMRERLYSGHFVCTPLGWRGLSRTEERACISIFVGSHSYLPSPLRAQAEARWNRLNTFDPQE